MKIIWHYLSFSHKHFVDEGAGPSNIRGDVNEDGEVTIADVVAVLNIMAGQ
jgi:hypothetical protein